MARESGNMFVACSGFPKCKHTISLPKGISQLKMMDSLCQACQQKHKREVHTFSLQFKTNHVTEEMKEVLDEDNFGTFCVCPDCDPKYSIVLNATNPAKKPNEGAPKRQYEGRYKKPDEKPVK
jgi:ssDNA-binding Zn-finger/Zn-ribbon topoisomerase 1